MDSSRFVPSLPFDNRVQQLFAMKTSAVIWVAATEGFDVRRSIDCGTGRPPSFSCSVAAKKRTFCMDLAPEGSTRSIAGAACRSDSFSLFDFD